MSFSIFEISEHNSGSAGSSAGVYSDKTFSNIAIGLRYGGVEIDG